MRQCQEVGCRRPIAARGWCRMHYQRFHRHGTPDPGHDREIVGALLDWVLDGEGLTTPAERAFYDRSPELAGVGL